MISLPWHVSAYGGAAGQILDPYLDPVADVPRLHATRPQEVRETGTILGVDVLRMLGCRDLGMPGVPAVLTPLGMDLAHGAGWPLLTVLMTQVIGFSTVIFPYQAPALVLVLERSSMPLTATLRLLMVLAVLTLVVLTPLNYLWWQRLGYFVTAGG